MTVEELEKWIRDEGMHVTPDKCVLPAVAAVICKCTEGTLRNWRSSDTGPDYYRQGRIWYRLDDLVAWSESRHVELGK
jgi:hypothetical protein